MRNVCKNNALVANYKWSIMRLWCHLPFISDSDTRRQTSSRVRFPDQDDDDLLLDVLPFPEERLALQQRVKVWTLQIFLDRYNLNRCFRQLFEIAQHQGLFNPRRGRCLSRRALTELEMVSRNRDSTFLGAMIREALTGRLPGLGLVSKVKQWILLGER